MRNVLECESSFDPKAHNPSDPHGGAHGIAQFLKPTFDVYSKKAGIENGDPYNPDDAIKTMAYMYSLKLESQWTCTRLIKEGKFIPSDST